MTEKLKNHSGNKVFKMKSIVVETFFLLLVPSLSVFLLKWQTNWNSLKTDYPLGNFSFDQLIYANWVSNAQSGSVLFNEKFGAPLGQQYGLSSYGYGWIQSEIIGKLAGSEFGPWAAMNAYILFSCAFTSLSGYFALRILSVNRLNSAVGSVAFAMATVKFGGYGQALYLGMLASFPPAIAICLKFLQGKQLDDIIFSRFSKSINTRINVLVLLGTSFLGFFGDFYYQMLIVLVITTICIIFFFRQRFRSALSTLVYLFLMLIPLFIAYTPIIFARLRNGLGLSEPSTADRRAFAAYANSGDIASLFTPLSPDSLVSRLLSNSKTYAKFMKEFLTSPINNNAEYSGHTVGIAFTIALVVVIRFFYPKTFGSKLNSGQSPDPSKNGNGFDVNSFLVLMAILVLWYVRGGLGTAFSFLMPQLRAYSRLSAAILFLSVTFVAVYPYRKDFRLDWFKPVSLSLLLLIAFDNISSIHPIDQNITKSIVKNISRQELAASNVFIDRAKRPLGFDIRVLGVQGNKELVRFAEKTFDKNCSVLVLPLVNFPADLNNGLTAYYSYETLKPGLTPSTLNWSSGGIPGTPNNALTDKFLPKYSQGDYGGFIEAIKSRGFCGIVFMRGLQDGFYLAGSNYEEGGVLTGLLIKEFGPPCYGDLESAVDLYCIQKTTN